MSVPCTVTPGARARARGRGRAVVVYLCRRYVREYFSVALLVPLECYTVRLGRRVAVALPFFTLFDILTVIANIILSVWVKALSSSLPCDCRMCLHEQTILKLWTMTMFKTYLVENVFVVKEGV